MEPDVSVSGSFSADFPVVGIGASAGGLNAFECFLAALPRNFSFSVVFVQHLSPKHTSLMPGILRSSRPDIEIIEIMDGLKIISGKIYICPPAKEVRIQAGIFLVSDRTEDHIHLPIDEFLVSLAEDAAENAIAVILSGAGTDGARGVQAVKSSGGIIFAQDPASAEFPGMPAAAINTGYVDAVLAPADIAREILKFGSSGQAATEAADLAHTIQIEPFYRVIYEKTGHRFQHFKKSVVLRRIRRRMYLHGISSLTEYLEKISTNDTEASMLADDLMIGVTSFFRDRLAWKALHLEVTRKLADLEDDSPIRVWTTGCATGEEAYSIAMQLQHELDLAGNKREIQVFATDVNERALEKAREGVYPISISADLPPDFMAKFFTRAEGGLWVSINKDMRQRVIFAKQDLLSDPPFSRLDLIICRNLLIYLEPAAQEKCTAIFHYALNPGGYLFLGNAESPARKNNLFKSVSHKKCRLYRKMENQLPPKLALAVPVAGEKKLSSKPGFPLEVERSQSDSQFIQEILLEEFAPAAVAIDHNYEIRYYNGPTNRFLRHPRGAPTQNLLELLPESLGVRIRGAIYKAGSEKKPVSIRTIIAGGDSRKRQVAIRISKLKEQLYLVVFREKNYSHEGESIPLETSAVHDTAILQLECELADTRKQLQSNIERLKGLNEELQSSNEEFQAANEELETSKEELQSLNEELTTVNAQFQAKIEEQEETNNDLNNFLASTNIPTIFLDNKLRVKRFTPAMTRLIKLIPADIGRPIMDMSQESLGPDLVTDAESVIDSLVAVKKEIRINGSWYLRAALPYRTADSRIEGVVITYSDITDLKMASEKLVRAKEEWERTFTSVPDLIAIIDNNHNVVRVNESMARRLGRKPEECVGMHCYEAVHGTSKPPDFCPHARTMRDGREHIEEVHEERLGGDFLVSTTPLYDDKGQMIGSVHVAHDITARKQGEEALRESERKYRSLFENMVMGYAYCQMLFDDKGRPEDFVYIAVNKAFENLTGIRDAAGKKVTEVIPGIKEAHPELFEIYGRVAATGQSEKFEIEFKPLNLWFSVSVYSTEKGRFVAIFEEITERKNAELVMGRLSAIIESAEDAIISKDLKGNILTWNAAAEKIFGYRADEVKGSNVSLLIPPGREYELPGIINRIMLGEHIEHFETVRMRKDGTIIPVSVAYSPIKNSSGKIIGISKIAHDVSRRKANEEAVMKSLKRFELLADAAAELLQSVEPQKLVESLCRRVMEKLDCQVFFNFLVDDQAGRLRLNAYAGISEEEAKKIEWLDYGVAVCGCAARDAVRIVAEHIPTTPDARTELVKSYGIKAYAAIPLMGTGGKVIGTLSFGTRSRETFSETDLSLMKAIADQVAVAMIRIEDEESLRESEARLQRSQEIAHLGSWELDLRRNVLSWSDEVYRIFGLQPQEFAATYEAFLERVYPDDRKAVDNAYSGSVREGRDRYEIEHRVVRKDTGEVRWVHERCQHIRDNEGKIISSLGMVLDITERRKAEEQIMLNMEELRAKNEELERFNRAAIGRELRMIELKKQVNEYGRKLGEEPPYKLDYVEE